MLNNIDKEPGSAAEWLDLGCFLRKNARFGEAMNAFHEAAASAEAEMVSACTRQEREALQDIIKKSLASVELIQEINGFVNTDLMNP